MHHHDMIRDIHHHADVVLNQQNGDIAREIANEVGRIGRVGMAHALLHEPDVLIMDEPTAGLDPNQIVEVRKTLMRIAEEKTILLSTHILQEVEAMAQRVIMINEGSLVYDGAAKGLIERHGSLDKAFHTLTAAVAAA